MSLDCKNNSGISARVTSRKELRAETSYLFFSSGLSSSLFSLEPLSLALQPSLVLQPCCFLCLFTGLAKFGLAFWFHLLWLFYWFRILLLFFRLCWFRILLRLFRLYWFWQPSLAPLPLLVLLSFSALRPFFDSSTFTGSSAFLVAVFLVVRFFNRCFFLRQLQPVSTAFPGSSTLPTLLPSSVLLFFLHSCSSSGGTFFL